MSTQKLMHQEDLTIKSVFGSYRASFVSSLTKSLIDVVDKKLHFLIDRNIWNLYRRELLVVNKSQSLKLLPGEEDLKTLKTVFAYLKFLLQHEIKRDHCLVVIGGGLTQDIGSFTAHILLRGINWIFIPTTLLAMADSCIGSKSGINVGGYKNQVGSFHPPQRIFIYLPVLKSLSQNALMDGKGEIIKHAIIQGGAAFNFLSKNIDAIPSNNKISRKIIFESLKIKKKIVEEDELERNKRRFLNYGHSFGHALEGYTHNRISHGIAITIGMDIANFISFKRGLLSRLEFDLISRLLHRNIPFTKLSINDTARYMNYLSFDKKVIGRNLNAVLCQKVGKVEVIPIGLDDHLQKEIAQYVNLYPKFHRIALA